MKKCSSFGQKFLLYVYKKFVFKNKKNKSISKTVRNCSSKRWRKIFFTFWRWISFLNFLSFQNVAYSLIHFLFIKLLILSSFKNFSTCPLKRFFEILKMFRSQWDLLYNVAWYHCIKLLPVSFTTKHFERRSQSFIQAVHSLQVSNSCQSTSTSHPL